MRYPSQEATQSSGLPGRLFLLLLLAVTLLTAERIDEYNTTIIVHPDGSLRIREQILYDFGETSRHGIFREIPLTVKLGPFRPEVPIGLTGFRALCDGQPVPLERSERHRPENGRMVRVRLGDPRDTLSGRHRYTLDYTVTHGIFPTRTPDREAIRWNAVGSGSSIPVRRAAVELILPSSLNRSTVHLHAYTGRYGSRDTRAEVRWIDSRRARFVCGELPPHEAFTVEAEFPAGALGEGADRLRGSWLDYLLYYWYLWAALGYLIWVRYTLSHLGTRPAAGSISPRYRPPEGFSLLRSGLLIDRFADREDLGAAILELGALGYLEIRYENEGKIALLHRTDKPLSETELTEDQRYLLKEVLFAESVRYRLDPDDPEHAMRIDRHLRELGERLYRWSVEEGWLSRDPRESRRHFLLRAGGAAVLLGGLAFYDLSRRYGMEVVIPLLMTVPLAFVGGSFALMGWRRRTWSWVIFGGVWVLFSLLGLAILFTDPESDISFFGSPLFLLAIMGITLWVGWRRVGRFTPKGAVVYRQLLGYRLFMERVERDRLLRLLTEEPDALERGLAYALLFGLVDRWMKAYELAEQPLPAWYRGDTADLTHFRSLVRRHSTPPDSDGSSSDDSEGSGGFSGGGSYAGGGGGGGSVGSW